MYRYGAPAVSSSSVCLFPVVIAITGRGGRLGGDQSVFRRDSCPSIYSGMTMGIMFTYDMKTNSPLSLSQTVRTKEQKSLLMKKTRHRKGETDRWSRRGCGDDRR